VRQLLKSLNFYLSVFILLIVFLIVLLNVLFKLEQQPRAPVTRLYYADNISSAHQELIRRFNDEYAGKIEVIPVNLPFTKFSTNERKELLARTLRSKSDRIDLFTVDIIWVPRFAKWCQLLDSFFEPQWKETVLPHVLRSSYYQGTLVSVPLYTDVGLMYFRRDLLKKLHDWPQIERRLKESITWDEFIKLGLEIRRRFPKNPVYIFPANNYEGLICSFFEGIARRNEDRFYHNPIQLTAASIESHVRLLHDLVHRYRLSPPIITKFDEFQGYLYGLEHDAVFIRGWPGMLKHYRNIIPDTSKLKLLEMAALPHTRGEKPAFVYGGWNFMLSKYSQKKHAAVQFIHFCLREENQKILFEMGGYIPVVKSVYSNQQYLSQHPDLVYYHQLLQNGVHRPYLENYTKISDILSYFIHQTIRGDLSPAEALQQATKVINTQQVLIK